MKEEIWKDIRGFEGFYQISNLGRVRSLDRVIHYKNPDQKGTTSGLYKGTIRKIRIGRSGYPEVLLSKNAKKILKRIHSLIAIHFIDNPHGRKEVNHIDGDKSNNSIENLEWSNRSENTAHSYKMGLRVNRKGDDNPVAIPVNQFDKHGNLIRRYSSLKSVNEYGFNSTCVRLCCLKTPKYHTHKGFIWSFAIKSPTNCLAGHYGMIDN
ncbi:NUMOD4 domain-containing protein [Pedobacter africanus]|uniref:HNH endonuclease n=1 Tax=Pedobacter africanus TaxID=151894 RepID=A0A1W1ZDC8_9SPHI|nr:NUMOD4 domain-containing protein [Pedobacter africanus]SMC46366.1 HNH endonuclease [Pedobacter africanus]